MVCGYLLFFLLATKTENSKKQMFNVGRAGDPCMRNDFHLAVPGNVFDGVFFVLSFFPQDVLDEIWD